MTRPNLQLEWWFYWYPATFPPKKQCNLRFILENVMPVPACCTQSYHHSLIDPSDACKHLAATQGCCAAPSIILNAGWTPTSRKSQSDSICRSMICSLVKSLWINTFQLYVNQHFLIIDPLKALHWGLAHRKHANIWLQWAFLIISLRVLTLFSLPLWAFCIFLSH